MAFFDLTNGADNVVLTSGQVAGLAVRGLDGNDTIRGSSDPEDINGNQGNDSILGGAGNDFLRGGQGDDTVDGEDGNDTVNGNFGNDLVFGGNGDDIVRGGQGNDTLSGGSGNDFLYGDLGTDILTGDDGNDVFVLRTDTAVANPLFADVITDFSPGDKFGLTGGLTEAGLTLEEVNVGPDGNGGTFIRIGSTGGYLGFVSNIIQADVVNKFVSAPD